MHSENRKGKRVKQARKGSSLRKSIYDLSVLFDKFYSAKTAEGLAPGSLDKYLRTWKYFAGYLTDNGIGADIRNIDIDLAREYIVWLLEDRVKFDGHRFKTDDCKTKGLSPRTVNDHIKSLRTWFNFLVAEGIAEYNPFENLKNVKQADADIDILNVEELKALLAAPDQRKYPDFRDYVVMHVLIDTMARINEVLTLSLRDVDFSDMTIVIRSKIAKSRKPRIIPIQKKTARLLKELIAEIGEFESEFIFLSNYGERLTTNHFRKQLNKFATIAGIKKNVHPHLFRHTGATMFLESGGDIRHLQMLLGHADLRMVTRYTHLTKQALIKQHNAYSPLNQVLGKLSKERKIKR